MTDPGQPVCVRHPNRPTRLSCTRCGRPACPDCLREAAVGHQCVDCAGESKPAVVHASTLLARQTPYLTYLLIALNVAVFVATVVQARSLQNNSDSALFNDWALYPPYVAHGQWIRIVGSAFLHFGPIHLLTNMFALYIVGPTIETVVGRWRFLTLYIVSMLGSAAAVMQFSHAGLTAGASGAIFGLFGATAAVLMKLRLSPGPVLGVIILNLIITFAVPGISVWGHLGGLTAGTLAGFGMLYGPQWLHQQGQTARITSWGAVLAVGVVSTILIYHQILALR